MYIVHGDWWWYNDGDFSRVVTSHSAITTFTTSNVTSLLALHSLQRTILFQTWIIFHLNKREDFSQSIFTPDRYRVYFWTKAKLIIILTYSHKKPAKYQLEVWGENKMTFPIVDLSSSLLCPVLSWLSCVYSWLGFLSKLQIITWQVSLRESASVSDKYLNWPEREKEKVGNLLMPKSKANFSSSSEHHHCVNRKILCYLDIFSFEDDFIALWTSNSVFIILNYANIAIVQYGM